MRKLTVLVDMDDTIENLLDAWVAYLNEHYGTSVRKEDITEWDMLKAFPMLEEDKIYGALLDESLWDAVRPLPGAVKYLKKIIDDGNEVFIVTASHPDSISMKMNKVLFRYFPYLTYQNVIITSRKQMILGDILIDDAPHNMGGQYFGMLFTAQHNKSIEDETLIKMNAIRVKDWREVYELIHGFGAHNGKIMTKGDLHDSTRMAWS